MKKYYLIIILLLTILTSCKAKTYKVTFMDDNKELSTIEVKKGTNLTNIDNPTKEGYIFLSWLKDGLEYNVSSPITKDITLQASWTEVPNPIKTYTITFNFGTELKTVSVKEGEKVSKPKEIPKKEKYKFLGWYVGETLYDFDTPVNKDIVLAAKFEKNRITINYDLDGGTGTIEVEIEKNSIPDRPKNPQKFGYTFKYWEIDGKLYNFDEPLNKDTTIKAIYEATIYVKVTFDTSGGNEITSKMLVSGDTLKDLPMPEKDGYIFDYWEYNGEEFDTEMKITKDITLIANYKQLNDN